MWIKIWEELHELVKRYILVEVAHFKAHHTKKEKEKMTKIERFVTEGNQKADELAKAGAMLDEGFMAEVTAVSVKQEREEVYVALQYTASFNCLVEEWKDCEELRPKPKEKLIFVDKRRERMKHRTEWCAEANRYRCVRCGSGRCQVDVTDHNSCQKDWENEEVAIWEVMTWSEEWTGRERS